MDFMGFGILASFLSQSANISAGDRNDTNPGDFNSPIFHVVEPDQLTPTPVRPKDPPVCRQYSKVDLHQILMDAGEFNPKFMAEDPEGTDRFQTQFQTPKHVFHQNPKEPPPLMVGNCGPTCQQLKKLMQTVANNNASFLNDFPIKQVHHELCDFVQFYPLYPCLASGSDTEIPGYDKLCSACNGIYRLQNHCYPRYFNSVTCTGNRECIFDWWGRGHGKCQEKKLTFVVLRNDGNETCQMWNTQYINVPVACECYLHAGSALASTTSLISSIKAHQKTNRR